MIPSRLRDEIRTAGPVSFARFMELALYDPEDGYYSRNEPGLGVQGDYFTASDVGRAFGLCLARQMAEIDGLLGRPHPFHAIEFGAGRGLLARDILDTARDVDPGWAERLRYIAVDRSRSMLSAARENAPEAQVIAPNRLGADHTGCLLAVELFDALPVHRLRRRDGVLVEICVDIDDDGKLVEREMPPAEQAAALASRYGAADAEQSEAEVCPAALDQLDAMAAACERAVMVIVDYGDEARRLYSVERRRGTLLAYHRHRTSESYLERVGEQDLTAHVNFTALEDRARALGMRVLGRTTQDRFLIANGILECFEQDDPGGWRDPAAVKQRLGVKQLIHPQGMGRAFQVLLLSKGCDPPPRLRGLRDPFG